MHFPEQSILSSNVSSENCLWITSAGPMAFINPSLKKKQVISDVWGNIVRNIVRNLTNDLEYIVNVSVFILFPFWRCVFGKATRATCQSKSHICNRECWLFSDVNISFSHNARFLNFTRTHTWPPRIKIHFPVSHGPAVAMRLSLSQWDCFLFHFPAGWNTDAE